MSLITFPAHASRPRGRAQSAFFANLLQLSARRAAGQLPRLALSAFAVALAVHVWRQRRR